MHESLNSGTPTQIADSPSPSTRTTFHHPMQQAN
jgi:hypothetical protein